MQQYGALMNDETQTLLKAKGGLVMEFGKQKLSDLRKYAEEGEWSWKIAGFLAGLLIIAHSMLAFISNMFGLAPFRAVLNIYMIVFGVAACILEFKERTLTQKYLDIIKRQALFLYNPYGRAAFYFFVGVLIVAEGGIVGFVVGGYCAFVGLVIYNSSAAAFAQLEKLHGSIHEKEVEEKFTAFDTDKSGFIDSHELRNLVTSMGAKMTVHELEAAMFILDENGDGRISLNEFQRWWCKRESFA